MLHKHTSKALAINTGEAVNFSFDSLKLSSQDVIQENATSFLEICFISVIIITKPRTKLM